MRKSFQSPSGDTLEVLRDISFSASAGETVAIRGASGAGKSTLLHLIGGLEAADSGSVKLSDFEVTRAHSSSLARYRNEQVGFVFQFHHLLPDLNALENVQLPLLISRSSLRESRERAVEALSNVGLSERTAHAIAHLSGGEQQRVGLARALVKRPRLVLADEPTGNLDAATGDEIGALLANYAQRQSAIVLIATHNMRLADACDRTLILENGRIREEQNSESRIQKSE
ncbi:MAG TPA: ABC transporter ATP-binding protein [Pyrinomonadaceae bacterium]|nr:ABC transporter ATP-binding protein [Pyrinomonadaceae bacterium]